MGYSKLDKLFHYMEDYDNVELGEYRRKDLLEEVVREYNDENNCNYKPESMYYQYLSWLREKQDR